MVPIVLVVVTLIAIAVAFRYGYLFSKAKEEAARFEALYHAQSKLIASLNEMSNQGKRFREILDKIDEASTAEDLQTIYNELISG